MSKCQECETKDKQIEDLEKKQEVLNKAIMDARGHILLSGIREGHPLYDHIDKAYHALAVVQS